MIMQSFKAIAAASVLGALPASALACGNPTEEWYQDASDVIFEGVARCDPQGRSCKIHVKQVWKNPLHLDVKNRTVEIDYYNWFTEYYEKNPDIIVLACGVPVFEPEEPKFSARFYANIDKDTQELVVRRYVSRARQTS